MQLPNRLLNAVAIQGQMSPQITHEKLANMQIGTYNACTMSINVYSLF